MSRPDLVLSGGVGRSHTRTAGGSRRGYDQRVSVLGYTTRMRELMSAADAFVTTTLEIAV